VLQNQIEDFLTTYEEKLEEVNILKNFLKAKQKLDVLVRYCLKILLLYADFFLIIVR